MKKLVLVFVCLLFAYTGWAADGNQASAYNPVISSAESSPIWQVLEKLTASERANAIIDIECEAEAEEAANIIEVEWNSGNYEKAIALLKNTPELENAAIGIQWKNPIKVSLRWGDDVRIGTRDSIKVVDLDVDNSTGHLLAALLYRRGASEYNFCINMSQDTGKTWAETYNWTAYPNYQIDIDAAVLGSYFYLAYTYTNNTLGRIRRFNTSDGTYDDTYGASGIVTVINEGNTLREIALASNADGSGPSYHLLYFAITDNDSLRNYWSNVTTSDGETWSAFKPDVGNADRGLDACCAIPNDMWASYIGTNDSLYIIEGWSGWSYYGPFAHTGTSSDYTTSISAYGDTVLAVYPYRLNSDSNYVRYRITYTGGNSWTWGTIYGPSDVNSYVNDVSARMGDGIGVVYQTSGNDAEGLYKHRDYAVVNWSTPASFADNVTRFNVKPSIERVASGLYGIAYVNYPEEMAWFDRNDWVSGIEEPANPNVASLLGASQVILNTQTDITFYLPSGQDNSLDIYDLKGSHVLNLAKGMPAGNNSATWFANNKAGNAVANGIYFCVLKSGNITESLKLMVIR